MVDSLWISWTKRTCNYHQCLLLGNRILDENIPEALGTGHRELLSTSIFWNTLHTHYKNIVVMVLSSTPGRSEWNGNEWNLGQGESSAKADCADWITKKWWRFREKQPKGHFSGFLPLTIIFIMSFIILMQSGFLYRGHCVGIGTGDFYSINEIILIGNILMVSVDCTAILKYIRIVNTITE